MEDVSENINIIESSKDKVTVLQNAICPILDSCLYEQNAAIRSRMYVNLFTAAAGKMLLNNYGVSTDDSYALQSIPSIIQKWDISELFAGGCRISVRYTFRDYKLFIPKKHEKYGLFGQIFMFIKLEDNYSARLLGFLPKDKLNKSNCDDYNYYVENNELQSFDEISKYFCLKYKPEDTAKLKRSKMKIIEYLEGTIDDKIAFMKQLAGSRLLREEMLKFEHSQTIYSNLALKEDEIKREIEKDVANISKLADAFIQSRNNILSHSEESAESFKIECARANLEKLFNSQTVSIADIESKSTDEVMDVLLTRSECSLKEDKPPVRILNIFVSAVLLVVFASVWFLYTNYSKIINSDNWLTVKNHVIRLIENVKKK